MAIEIAAIVTSVVLAVYSHGRSKQSISNSNIGDRSSRSYSSRVVLAVEVTEAVKGVVMVLVATVVMVVVVTEAATIVVVWKW